jgi:TusA-related sulfurtransferase
MPEEKFLDLAGTPCPMNFVHIKVALSQLPPGEVIRARLDSGEAATDLKRTLIEQGYHVLGLGQEGSHEIISVKKV